MNFSTLVTLFFGTFKAGPVSFYLWGRSWRGYTLYLQVYFAKQKKNIYLGHFKRRVDFTRAARKWAAVLRRVSQGYFYAFFRKRLYEALGGALLKMERMKAERAVETLKAATELDYPLSKLPALVEAAKRVPPHLAEDVAKAVGQMPPELLTKIKAGGAKELAMSIAEYLEAAGRHPLWRFLAADLAIAFNIGGLDTPKATHFWRLYSFYVAAVKLAVVAIAAVGKRRAAKWIKRLAALDKQLYDSFFGSLHTAFYPSPRPLKEVLRDARGLAKKGKFSLAELRLRS